jgi:hypothetical protein
MSDLDDIVSVAVTVTDKAPTKASFGIPLIAGYHTAWLDYVREYAEADDMLDDGFTTTSPLYLAALVLKAQDPAPPRFKVGRLATAFTQTVDLIPTVTTEGYVYNFSIAGAAIAYTVLAAATTTTVATALELLVEAVAGISSTSTGPTVTAVSAAGTLNSYAWARGLNVIDMTADPGIAADLALIAAEDSDWYGLALICPNSDAIVKAAALWIEAQSKIFIPMSGDWDIIDAGQTADLASDLKALSYARCPLIWHRFIGGTEWANAAWLAIQLAPDPGSATAANKTLAGISADDLRAGELTAIQNKNATWYTTKHGISITFEGKAPGGRFIDSTRFIDWMIETIQVDIFALLVNNPKLPYDNSGIQVVKTTIEIAINKGQKAGGVALSPEPLVTVPDVLDTDVADRALRILRDVKFNFRLAGALHRVVVQGTVSV